MRHSRYVVWRQFQERPDLGLKETFEKGLLMRGRKQGQFFPPLSHANCSIYTTTQKDFWKNIFRAKKICKTLFFNVYYFIWLHWVLVVAHGIFIASCETFVVAHSLSSLVWELSFSAACGILLIAPWPGIEPTLPALQGGLLTTGQLEKPLKLYFCSLWVLYLVILVQENLFT